MKDSNSQFDSVQRHNENISYKYLIQQRYQIGRIKVKLQGTLCLKYP
jgi:hypothetical protein